MFKLIQKKKPCYCDCNKLTICKLLQFINLELYFILLHYHHSHVKVSIELVLKIDKMFYNFIFAMSLCVDLFVIPVIVNYTFYNENAYYTISSSSCERCCNVLIILFTSLFSTLICYMFHYQLLRNFTTRTYIRCIGTYDFLCNTCLENFGYNYYSNNLNNFKYLMRCYRRILYVYFLSLSM